MLYSCHGYCHPTQLHVIYINCKLPSYSYYENKVFIDLPFSLAKAKFCIGLLVNDYFFLCNWNIAMIGMKNLCKEICVCYFTLDLVISFNELCPIKSIL